MGAIPGACGEATMIAAMEAMRHAPRGDVVEIGAGWGRSAMLLLWLTRRYQVGPLLCVDPWLNDTLVKGAPRADEALAIFEINLAPFADGRLNYLRARSADAARAYGEALTVTTEAFGTTVYQGQIAFLHIDGAHAEAEVARDCELWSPHVVPGGWIHFDDYDWAFGDGPRRVADAFVARSSVPHRRPVPGRPRPLRATEALRLGRGRHRKFTVNYGGWVRGTRLSRPAQTVTWTFTMRKSRPPKRPRPQHYHKYRHSSMAETGGRVATRNGASARPGP